MNVQTARKRNWALKLLKCMKAQLKTVKFFFSDTEELKDNQGNWIGTVAICESMLRDLEKIILTELPAKEKGKNDGKTSIL